MFTHRFYASILTFCLALTAPLAVWAEDVVSPPPEVAPKAEPAAPSSVKDKPAVDHSTAAPSDINEDVDLKKELVPENIDKNVSVHAYIRKTDKAEISEYSIHGRVYMIKVKPAGAMAAYYLYDDNGDGTFNKRLPSNYKHLNPPSWVLATF